MWFVALLTGLIVLLIFYFLDRKKKSVWLAFFGIPTFLLILSEDANVMSKGLFSSLTADVLFFVASVILVLFPVSFLFKNLRKDFGLLVFLSLVIEWDWIVTWRFLHNYAFSEINTLLNTSSFVIFTIQKLSPIFLFVILYKIALSEKKLMHFLDYGLIAVSVGYYFVFLWQLYVISFIHIETLFFAVTSVILTVIMLIFVLTHRKSVHLANGI